MLPIDLIHLYLNGQGLIIFEVSPWIYGPIIVFAVIATIRWYWRSRRHFNLVRLNIKLGGIGSADVEPTLDDIDITHKIWIELVTRKAAIPIDEENDVISEVYDSWYAMFGRIRLLIADLPPNLVRSDKDTQVLIRIATDSLNLGLRPHLTRWQAQFQNWYEQQAEKLKMSTPQEVQKEFPDYEELMTDLKHVNANLIQYAEELKKISQGS